MINITIADDHAVVRHGLKTILSEENNFKILSEAGTIQELLLQLQQVKPDILILDLSMPGGNGIEGLCQVHELYPRLEILVLSIHPEEQYAIRVLRAGASGYLSKECAPELLVKAVRCIMSGEKFISKKVGKLLADQMIEKKQKQLSHSDLSDREYYVFGELAKGMSLTNIADSLSLNVKTVSTYRSRILRKLGMSSNAEMVQYAIKEGIL